MSKSKQKPVEKSEAEIRKDVVTQYYFDNLESLKAHEAVKLENLIRYDAGTGLLFVKDPQDHSRFVSFEKEGDKHVLYGAGPRSQPII